MAGLLGKALMAGLMASLPQGDRAYRYDHGRYDGQFVGRGDGGFDALDERGRYAGKVVQSFGSPGFDIYDERGRFQGNIRR
jgi:hypothetical protein